MEFAALCFAVAGALLTLLQGVVSVPFIGSASLFDILRFMTEPIVLQNLSGREYLLILLLLTIPAMGICGGILAFKRKGGTGPLIYSAIVCALIWAFVSLSLNSASREARMAASMFVSPGVFLLWTICYAVGAVLAYMSGNTPPSTESYAPEAPQPQVPTRAYEPLTGIETDALIRRAYIFLEDGQFDDAARYFEQALNQDPEDPRIHLGQLVLERRAHNIKELIENLSTPLENERLFQRAVRFADDATKAELEEYARASNEYIEQSKIKREAEHARLEAEIEADKERRYQEIISLRENAASVEDMEKILMRASSLIPYKDSEEIYIAVSKSLKTEKDYQDALSSMNRAGSSGSLKNIIEKLEALDGYKDSAELLAKAQSALEDAQNREARLKKYAIAAAACVLLAAAGMYGIKMWLNYSKQKAQEQAIVQAQENRKNAIISFFEGKTDEAYRTIQSLPGLYNDPVLLQILSYRDGDKTEYINRIPSYEAKKFYDEAISLANNYQSQPNASKFLGDAYMNGWGVAKDTNRAFTHFKIPAENGDAHSQKILADMYYESGDYDNAAKYYVNLAETGDGQTQERLALMYQNGQGVPKDMDKAYELFPKAAEKGQKLSQYVIGMQRSYNGDNQDAMRWLQLSAQQGYAPAQGKIGLMYENGSGVGKNYTEAAKYYRMAADQGDADSQERLARLYAIGLGVKQDLNEARNLYKLAMDNGKDSARAEYERLTRRADNEKNQQRIAQMTFPVAATITGDRVNVRSGPSINNYSVNRLNSGHPVSIYRRSSENDGDWYNIMTASGTRGWVRGDFVRLNENTQNQYENDKRSKRLPARAVCTDRINVRSIPSTQSSRALTVLDTGTELTVYEIFAGPDGDWFRIRANNNAEGWVFGKYVEFR